MPKKSKAKKRSKPQVSELKIGSINLEEKGTELERGLLAAYKKLIQTAVNFVTLITGQEIPDAEHEVLSKFKELVSDEQEIATKQSKEKHSTTDEIQFMPLERSVFLCAQTAYFSVIAKSSLNPITLKLLLQPYVLYMHYYIATHILNGRKTSKQAQAFADETSKVPQRVINALTDMDNRVNKLFSILRTKETALKNTSDVIYTQEEISRSTVTLELYKLIDNNVYIKFKPELGMWTDMTSAFDGHTEKIHEHRVREMYEIMKKYANSKGMRGHTSKTEISLEALQHNYLNCIEDVKNIMINCANFIYKDISKDKECIKTAKEQYADNIDTFNVQQSDIMSHLIDNKQRTTVESVSIGNIYISGLYLLLPEYIASTLYEKRTDFFHEMKDNETKDNITDLLYKAIITEYTTEYTKDSSDCVRQRLLDKEYFLEIVERSAETAVEKEYAQKLSSLIEQKYILPEKNAAELLREEEETSNRKKEVVLTKASHKQKKRTTSDKTAELLQEEEETSNRKKEVVPTRESLQYKQKEYIAKLMTEGKIRSLNHQLTLAGQTIECRIPVRDITLAEYLQLDDEQDKVFKSISEVWTTIMKSSESSTKKSIGSEAQPAENTRDASIHNMHLLIQKRDGATDIENIAQAVHVDHIIDVKFNDQQQLKRICTEIPLQYLEDKYELICTKALPILQKIMERETRCQQLTTILPQFDVSHIENLDIDRDKDHLIAKVSMGLFLLCGSLLQDFHSNTNIKSLEHEDLARTEDDKKLFDSKVELSQSLVRLREHISHKDDKIQKDYSNDTVKYNKAVRKIVLGIIKNLQKFNHLEEILTRGMEQLREASRERSSPSIQDSNTSILQDPAIVAIRGSIIPTHLE